MLHTPTLLFVNVSVMATLAICLGMVAPRGGRDGLRLWAGALAAQSLAYLLFGLRGLVSDWLSILVGNVLLFVSFSLMIEGLLQFQRTVRHRLYIWAPVAVGAMVFLVFMHDARVRILLGNLLILFQLGQLCLQLRVGWAQMPGRGKYLVLVAFLVFVLIIAVRCVALLIHTSYITNVTDTNLVQAATFLLASITMTLANFGMVVMSKERADALNRDLALHDELTRLHNRRYIQQTLPQQIAQATRLRQPLSVLMLDIDHFKRVNDSFGHLSGDKVLRQLAACITERLRAQDIAGRWGGEEFIVILPNTDATGGRVLAEGLRAAVGQERFTALDGQPIPLTISVGLHAMLSSDEETGDGMVGMADRALYLAKENGRNRVEQL
ncbi:MAG: GGDEF domain-containing protein [Hylemonella sp.]|nr:GGDEF domain-containing protein [Hylemonella sp.]